MFSLIGKSAKPRCFKHVNMDALPVLYYSQKSAWMNTAIFSDWFKKHFVPAVIRHQEQKGIHSKKALLLLDNAPSHPDAEELTCDKICAKFLPANTTSLIQPMDQGVLESLKRRHKKLLLRKFLEEDEHAISMFAALKGINMKHVVYMSAEAWDDVPSTTLLKSWNKLLRRTEEITQETDDLESSTTELQPFLTKLGCDTSEEEVRRWLSGS